MQSKKFRPPSSRPAIPNIPVVKIALNKGRRIAIPWSQNYDRFMTRPIHQSVKFPATAKELYDLYLDPKRHAAFTGGGKVKISARPGSPFFAFNKMLTGTTLFTVPNQLIVQRWRSMNFKDTDLDSILILEFTQKGKQGKQGQIDLTHVNVPKQDCAGVTNGWKKYYWTPLRTYLKKP